MAADNLAQPADLIGKLETLARRYGAARGDVQRSEVDEALNRTRLGVALADALLARAKVEGEARELALAGYLAAAAKFVRPRRRNRISRMIDRLLDLGRSPGRALIIARSGVWEGQGGLRSMASYARRGADPVVQPAAIFDQAWYLKARPDLAGTRASPLVHYLLHGGAEGASPHPLFDSDYYAGRNAADLAATGLTPLEHFVRIGAAEGRDPHPLFSIAHYVRQAPDLIASGGDPIAHYLQVGWRKGLNPHPLFAADFYAPQMAGAPEPPLVHYLTQGADQGLRPHPLFDPDWYRGQYPDVVEGGFEPLSHYAAAGGAEGRHPSPWFDAVRYVALRGSDLPAGRNALTDYLQGGAWSVSEPWPGRATAAFLSAASELAVSGMTPLEHWARRGGPQTPSA